MSDEVLTIHEAAHVLKVSVEVVTDLLMSGELPGREVAGEWRTTTRALVSYVDGVPLSMTCCPPGVNCCTPGEADCC